MNDFLLAFHNSAFLQNLFIRLSKYHDLTSKEFNKLYDPQAAFQYTFYEGKEDDIPCEIDHLTIETVQKDFKPILKRTKNKEKK